MIRKYFNAFAKRFLYNREMATVVVLCIYPTVYRSLYIFMFIYIVSFNTILKRFLLNENITKYHEILRNGGKTNVIFDDAIDLINSM